ncbi:MAG TPA: helix-turn-helix domain-containing protein [Bacillota bacterium]
MTDLGHVLRRLRKSKRMSIYDVEKRTGLHFSSISKYERNERLPSLQVLKELAELYGVPLGNLVFQETTADIPPESLAAAALLVRRPDLAELFRLLQELSPEQAAGVRNLIRAFLGGDTGPATDADA